MTRSALQDHLQVYPFYLIDVAPIEALALPIFTPLFGFSEITAPELYVEFETIQEGNWPYPRKVVKAAGVSTMTLQRGALFYDSDFYRWIKTAVSGDTEDFQSKQYGLSLTIGGGALSEGIGENVGTAALALASVGGLFGFPRIGGVTYRRDLLLVQTFAHYGLGNAGLGFGILLAGLFGGPTLTGAATALGAALDFGGLGAKVDRLPARAWKLKSCIPTRYKVASDFDAMSSEVSIMELDIEVEQFTEVSLAGG